ncbi:MAG: hypothetical protein ACR2RV_06425 [Verrucomicrobiales bacterium]
MLPAQTAKLSALDIQPANASDPESNRNSPANRLIVEEIIADRDLPPLQKAQKLLDLTDQLSGDPALAACDFALLCLDEERYEPAFEKLTAEGASPEIRQAIMADLMERSDFLRLPLLVQLASQSEHPFSEDARVELVSVLGDDYGTNWLGWSDGIADHLEFASGTSGAGVLQSPLGDRLPE